MKREEVFERLDPPPGGPAKLRERLDRHDRSARRMKIAFAAAPAFALAAAVLLVILTRPRVPDLVTAARARGSLDEVTLGLSDAPSTSVALEPQRRATTALVEMRTENPDVVFYWVATTE